MNWYKKAQSYIEIGHGNNFVLWYSDNGFDIIRSKTNEAERHSQWDKYEIEKYGIRPFSGRYDIDRKIISVVGKNYKYPPQSLIDSLIRTFPSAQSVFIYTGFQSNPEIIRAASVIKLASDEDVIDEYHKAQEDVLYEFIRNPRGKQKWTVIPSGRLKKIWKDYATYGTVRDVQGLEEIAKHMITNIMKLQANTDLAGHTSVRPKDIYENVGVKWTQKREDLFGNFILDDGQWRISDYGLPKLMDLAFKLGNVASPEEKLLIIDQMLNVFHQRSNLPAMFVEGGGITLDELYESPEERKRIEETREIENQKKSKPAKLEQTEQIN